ncbi:MAG: Tetratricopeptide 1 repeat-containing protein [Bacteroidetes bacterium]|nr:Tetratricopeptide 1 repeat-containing protein [Bacteroidota bacterium]
MKKWIVWLGLAGVMLFTSLAYSGHFHNAFHIDDIHTIVNNAYIRDLHNIPLFFTDGHTSSSHPPNQTYRPILTTSLALDYQLGGGNGDTWMYHLTSFFIFLCVGISLFFLYRAIFRKTSPDPSSDIVAVLAVGWFMLHPVCAETVNYIVQRGDLLATFFVVLGLNLYILSVRARRYYLYLIPVIAGILTKPIAVVFPLLLIAYILLFEQKEKSPPLRKYWPHITMALIVSIAAGVFVTTMTSATYQTAGDDPWLYRFTQPYVLGQYFVEWFAPLWLAADNGMKVFASPLAPMALLGYGFIAAVIGAIIYTSRRSSTRPVAFGLSWYLIANIPTSLISLNEVATDHRMFFPYVGLSLAMTWSLYLVVKWIADRAQAALIRPLFLSLSLAGLLCYGYGAHMRCQVWRSEESLWSDAVAKYPVSVRAHLDYGLALMVRSALPEAEKQFAQALAIQPDFAPANLDMGIVKHLQNKDTETETYLKHALAFGRNTCPSCYYYYAMYLNEHNRIDEAIALLYSQYQMSAANVECRELLMEFMYKAHRVEELKKIIAATLVVSPGDSRATYYDKLLSAAPQPALSAATAEDHLNLSGQAYRTGDYQKCIDEAQKALELKPSFAPAYNNLGAAFNKLQRYKEAKDASLKALGLDPSSHFAKINLDAAEAGLKSQVK